MSKQSLLLVDGDTRSLRVLEVSLRKAGFSVTPAVSVGDALDKLEINPPDLIISETKFATELDGFELRRRLRGAPEWAEIPFIFLTAETAIENKIKGLELGVDDYLTKPIYIKEIVTRINILLQKRQRQFLDLRKDGTRFAGRVADMPVVDVIQTIEVSRKSGVIQFAAAPNRQAAIYFRDGKVIDAEAGTLQGEDAVYRLLTWNDGEFEVEFRTVRRREVIEASSQGLLMEGMRRLDEWSRLLEQLPPLSHRFEIDAAELSTRLGEVPDDNNRILRLFDGKRTLLEVIDASDFGDLECLQAISRLYFEGLLLDLDPAVRPARDISKPMPVVQVEPSSSPMRVAASGPIDLTSLEARASQPEITPPALERTAPVQAVDVMSSEPLVSPRELAAQLPRSRRDSGQAVDDSDVVAEEEVHSPLAGGYRPSSLRLIDEAVAAAQLIEPSLFADDELAALGIPRATPQQVAAARDASAPPPPPAKSVTTGWDAVADPTESPAAPGADDPRSAAIARMKEELGSADPRIEHTPAGDDKKNGANGHAPAPRSRTLPPPLPPSIKAKQVDEPELLDSALLTSGEIRIPSDEELAADAPLLDADLLTSGEIKIPSEAALGGHSSKPPPAPKGVTMGWDAVPDPTDEPAANTPAKADEPVAKADEPVAKVENRVAKSDEPVAKATEPATAIESAREPVAKAEDVVAKIELNPAAVVVETKDDDSAGVPTPIEADSAGELPDEGPTDPSRKRAPIRPDDSQAIRMIGSAGRDRAEASGELRPPHIKASEAATQRELVTIMPRRKTGEVAQLSAEDVSTLDSKGQAKAKAAVEALDAAADAAKAKAATEAKPEAAPAADAKPTKTEPEAKPVAKPALEAPRRVSVEGGVVVPQRGPGRGAQILIALASILAGAAVFSYCRKPKTSNTAVVTKQDAGDRIVLTEIDADYNGFGVDAGEVRVPDAGRPDRPDAAVRADAAIVVLPPDAANVAIVRPDAGSAVPVTGDAGTGTVDKAKEAAALASKGRAALAEGDPKVALDLFDQALKIKKDKRTYVDRGRALHNLGKTDEAVASIDEAIKMSNGYAPAWEQKGLILWSAQKYGDARPALEMYLQLQPDGPKADTIRKMLDEPR